MTGRQIGHQIAHPGCWRRQKRPRTCARPRDRAAEGAGLGEYPEDRRGIGKAMRALAPGHCLPEMAALQTIANHHLAQQHKKSARRTAATKQAADEDVAKSSEDDSKMLL